MQADRTAAIVTVGTEITTGLRLDTNTRDVAFALLKAGYRIAETVSLPDDHDAVVEALRRLTDRYGLVVVTGGLGPTHDDITRDAAADALQMPLVTDDTIAMGLSEWAHRQGTPEALARVMRQALVLRGATTIMPTTGTAPGQIVTTAHGSVLVLLPGPPREMTPMLAEFLGDVGHGPLPRELSCTGITESDAQIAAQAVLEGFTGIDLALLAKPADIRVILLDAGAGEATLDTAARAVRAALGDACYADDGSSLAEAVVLLARSRGVTIATAESCTGGMVGAALTGVPGSSEVYRGGSITYSNDAKSTELGVADETLSEFGSVSAQTAAEMSAGARERFAADIAVAVTGIAGPGGGNDDKPVGLVWFGVATAQGVETHRRLHPGDRDGVRARATIAALHLLWRTLSRM